MVAARLRNMAATERLSLGANIPHIHGTHALYLARTTAMDREQGVMSIS
jgi:hypothetical protein